MGDDVNRGVGEPALAVLEATLGYSFVDCERLVRALTHRSHANERSPAPVAGSPPLRHNEQLEFLGDAVLGLIVSEELIRRYPDLPEGGLSRMKAYVVSANHLFLAAQALDLGRFLRLGRGEELTGGRDKRTLVADALEALIAAVYLDGGIGAARQLVCTRVLDVAAIPTADILDYKNALQELVQARKLPAPRYVTVRERGPDHCKSFTVEVRIGKNHTAQAEALTKKGAAQLAAREMFDRLQRQDGDQPHY